MRTQRPGTNRAQRQILQHQRAHLLQLHGSFLVTPRVRLVKQQPTDQAVQRTGVLEHERLVGVGNNQVDERFGFTDHTIHWICASPR